MIKEKTGPWVFSGRSANDFYQDMLSTIRLDGEAVAPRGLPTTELLHVVTRIENPRCRVLSQIGRKLNPFFNLAETLWILRGESRAEWILYYNSQLRKYLDPPLRDFHGAYGERMRFWPRVSRMGYGQGHDINRQDQLLYCYKTLREGPESRQAVIVIFNPMVDGFGTLTLDRPCNIAVSFKVRRGRLWMSVFNRSNDVVLGLTSTNIVQFSTAQESLAAWLGVEVGPYSHYSDSLHLYDSQETVRGGAFNVYDYVDPTPMLQRTPGEFDKDLADLYQRTKAWQMMSGEELSVEGRVLDGDFLEEGVCPYWSSVAWALLAYSFHKQKAGSLALKCVGNMQTADWKIECLRFLADRYEGKDGYESFSTDAGRIISAIPMRGGLVGRQAIWSYVFQSYPPESVPEAE